MIRCLRLEKLRTLPRASRLVWDWGSVWGEGTPGKDFIYLDPLRDECNSLSQSLLSSPNSPKALGGGQCDRKSGPHLQGLGGSKWQCLFHEAFPQPLSLFFLCFFGALELPQYSIEDTLLPSNSSKCFSKCVLRIPIRILWGAVRSADRLSHPLLTEPGKLHLTNVSGAYSPLFRAGSRGALGVPVHSAPWCTADTALVNSVQRCIS